MCNPRPTDRNVTFCAENNISSIPGFVMVHIEMSYNIVSDLSDLQ